VFEGPGADPEYRAALERRLRLHGISSLLEELKRVDPFTASTIDVSKPRRVIRALEVFHLSGIPISEHHRVSQVRIDFEHRQFGMLWERRDLYERIEQRCERMVAEGLLDEVDGLEKRGYGEPLHALASVGYAEAFAYRRGEVSYAEMMRLFKQNSRRYAKRQMTWFRRDSRITWLNMHPARTIDSVCDEIAERFLGN
jgi:tRNA dimethylallyltransferase